MTMMTLMGSLLKDAQSIAGDIRQPGDSSRFGYGMHVSTGNWYFPLDPRPGEVFIEDIAHGLSMQCRFNGQCRRFLSVAEHCYLASLIVPQEFALEALLHDGAEAYIGDIIRPVKLIPQMASVYLPIERANEAAIAERFQLKYPWPASVKRADEQIVSLEMTDNIANREKGTLHEEIAIEGRTLTLGYWEPALAKAIFLSRFMDLARKRGLKVDH